MGSTTIRRFALSAILPIAVIVACASGPRIRYRHEYTLAPGQEHHAGVSKVLLIPIDAANAEPVKGLDAANERVSALIVSHLQSKGIHVEEVDRARFQTATNEAYRSIQAKRMAGTAGTVSAKVDFSDVVPEILEKLELPSDGVVSANLLMRTGVWNGGSTLVWDGVRRRDRTAGAGSTTGNTPAASLQVAVYSSDGTRVFSGVGGLDHVFQFNLQKKVMEIREDLLQNERNLAEGVCVAFYPYFGPDEYCAR
jgi:hypothetical protein